LKQPLFVTRKQFIRKDTILVVLHDVILRIFEGSKRRAVMPAKAGISTVNGFVEIISF